jgi:hypothetical protein
MSHPDPQPRSIGTGEGMAHVVLLMNELIVVILHFYQGIYYATNPAQ